MGSSVPLDKNRNSGSTHHGTLNNTASVPAGNVKFMDIEIPGL